ncbi:MAG TPA: rhodanese-like domain-containing protein [Methyloceanibacter sp.]|nr:rhodanese-like domain-containing protein [Methyloceanibacter sp.]
MSLPTITPADAKRLLDQGATLIDIRETGERAREHIPGSQHGPLSQISGDSFEDVSAPIIFHCRSGMRTATNAGKLKEAAPCEAYVLSGGIDAWKRAGLPVVSDQTQRMASGRRMMVAGGSAVLLGVLLGIVISPAFYLLAAFAGAGLSLGGGAGWFGMAKSH